MTTFPNSPRLLRGAIVLVNPDSAAIQRLIVLQFNPETLTRSFQIKSLAGESGDRSETLRLMGPLVKWYFSNLMVNAELEIILWSCSICMLAYCCPKRLGLDKSENSAHLSFYE
jgi:hypothetical protein